MEKIAMVLRSLQLYAHQAHNLISGKEFFADHGFLGELYPAYEADYDDVIERSIGLGKPINIKKVNQAAAESLQDDSSVKENCFEEILQSEEYLCEVIQDSLEGLSEGTRQLLGGIADKSEMRQYKLKQRIAG